MTRAVLFDIDGVLTVSWDPLEGAAEAVERVRAAGLGVAFVTNTTSKSRRRIAELLRGVGIALDDEEVITAARAAASYLAEHFPGARCLLLNHGSIGDDLEGVHLVDEDADVVLTGGAGESITYAQLNEAFRRLLEGAALVAMQRNWFWNTAEGPQLDIGAFVVGLEQAANVTATLVGKPSPAFYAAVLEHLGVHAADAVMIGDDIEADVLGSQACGLTGVLVRTGKYRPDVVGRAGGQPHHVIDSVADLPGLLRLT